MMYWIVLFWIFIILFPFIALIPDYKATGIGIAEHAVEKVRDKSLTRNQDLNKIITSDEPSMKRPKK